jgi:peptide chain release factor 1
MVPLEKVKDIVTQYETLERELSSGSTDPKLFAKKSKEYSRLGRIITIARQFVNFEGEKKDLENMVQDKKNFNRT